MDNEVFEENEEYTPIEPQYYNYKAKEDLLLYFDNDISSFNKIYISSYKVNNTSLKPFLNEFLRTKKDKIIQFFNEQKQLLSKY